MMIISKFDAICLVVIVRVLVLVYMFSLCVCTYLRYVRVTFVTIVNDPCKFL